MEIYQNWLGLFFAIPNFLGGGWHLNSILAGFLVRGQPLWDRFPELSHIARAPEAMVASHL
jgi:hypothetical protein